MVIFDFVYNTRSYMLTKCLGVREPTEGGYVLLQNRSSSGSGGYPRRPAGGNHNLSGIGLAKNGLEKRYRAQAELCGNAGLHHST